MMNQMRPTGFSILPPVVKNLLIINCILFLTKVVLDNAFNYDLDDLLGLHYWSSELFRPWQIVTYLFMHANFEHLFFNMFAVWMFGNAIENVWGQKRFINYYLVTGFGAAILHYAIVYWQIVGLENVITPENLALVQSEGLEAINKNMNFIDDELAELNLLYNSSIVGASGSLFGLLLAFGMLFPNSEIYIYFLFPLKAKYFVAIYGAIELFSGFANRPGDNIAHFAHLGGMLFGYLLIIFWKNQSQKRIN